MKHTIKKEERYTILTVDEEKLDALVTPQLKSKIQSILSDGCKNLILNLENVKYTDSSGLSALLVGNRLFTSDNRFFAIAKSNEHLLKLIKISQLDKIFHLFPTLEESIEAVFLNDLEDDLKSSSSE